MGRKRRRKDELEPPDPDLSSFGSSDTDSSESPEAAGSKHKDPKDKYKIYKVKGYTRKYPEDTNQTELIVFLNHLDENKVFSDRDRMALSKGIREHGVSGVMHLRSINKYKVGITFDLPNNANMFIQNKKLLDQLSLNATIPASDTEVTGVLTSVPIDMSNKQVFSLIGSSKNVVQVRRFMRRVKGNDGVVKFIPTQAVAVTFASTILPNYIYLDSWRHEVSKYIPPVKQYLKCLKYGHIAKFCRNAEVCSICTLNHNFKNCQIDSKDATCVNCKGNHVAISSTCPIKKQKVEISGTTGPNRKNIFTLDSPLFVECYRLYIITLYPIGAGQ
ncbi:hypothetical protein O3G_MSEX014342 [Manduca sexta]|uniref:Uncharacterized protein n=1 Tax=Manduca sexta TaxID=7130 RepID=A0A921ZTI0_MANSE|nr:hypothetical protein O3G_MSEX014342 [Manduca sexta]